MIGIIVTGHGFFATGITSALKLLVGEPEQFEAVDFEPEDSIDMLTDKLKAAVERLKDCEGILLLTDLRGGSPYNVASRLCMSGKEGMEVLAGTNLPMLIEVYMTRGMAADVVALADTALKAGSSQVLRFERAAAFTPDDDDEIEMD
ncbi:MAG: PTS sugar transporter subunit IIA [Hungatella hathewayi]|nr:PTS sugar transporter subunit IIA [Hungatella hathewayi]